MMLIPVMTMPTPDGAVNAPSIPFPADAVAIACDGTNYAVYQAGDTQPQPPQE